MLSIPPLGIIFTLCQQIGDTVTGLAWRDGHPEESAYEEERGEDERGGDEVDEYHLPTWKLQRCGRQIQNLLYHQSHGYKGVAAEIFLYLLHTDSTFYKELREEMDLPSMDGLKEEVAMFEGIFFYVKQAVSVIRAHLPSLAWWIALQVLAAVFGAGGGEGSRRRERVKDLTGLSDAALNSGRRRFSRLEDGNLPYNEKKDRYKNKVDDLMKEVAAMGWKFTCLLSPNKHDTVVDHVRGPGMHKKETVEDRYGTRVVVKCQHLTNNEEEREGNCLELQARVQHKSADKLLAELKSQLADLESLTAAQKAAVEDLKLYKFKQAKPFNVKWPTLVTCVCPHHKKTEKFISDMNKALLWKEAHRYCGTDDPRGCSECENCKSGDCRKMWEKAMISQHVILDMLLCKRKEGSSQYNVKCIEGKCKNCCFYEKKINVERWEVATCPLMKTLSDRIRKERDNSPAELGLEEVDAPGSGKVRIHVWGHRTQGAYNEYEHREQLYHASTVGGQEAEAGGRQTSPTKVDVVEEKELTWEEALIEFIPRLEDYVVHQHAATNQAKAFKAMCDKPRPGELIICTDFNQNIPHTHQEAFQGEHWCKFQSSLMPNVCIRCGKEDKALLEAIVAVSDDLTHSNNFVHHVLERIIKMYKQFTNGGLKHVHIWSDGCSEQYKSRHEMLWVSEVPVKLGGVIVHHHYFASCHGKNMCDGLGGYIKTWIAREELRGTYFADTNALLPWLRQFVEGGDFDGASSSLDVTALGLDDSSTYVKKEGKFSTIRVMHIPFGEVIHHHLYSVSEVKGIKSYHSFTSDGEKKVRNDLCRLHDDVMIMTDVPSPTYLDAHSL